MLPFYPFAKPRVVGNRGARLAAPHQLASISVTATDNCTSKSRVLSRTRRGARPKVMNDIAVKMIMRLVVTERDMERTRNLYQVPEGVTRLGLVGLRRV